MFHVLLKKPTYGKSNRGRPSSDCTKQERIKVRVYTLPPFHSCSILVTINWPYVFQSQLESKKPKWHRDSCITGNNWSTVGMNLGFTWGILMSQKLRSSIELIFLQSSVQWRIQKVEEWVFRTLSTGLWLFLGVFYQEWRADDMPFHTS